MLEPRLLMAIVQPPGSNFVAFEAEDANAIIVDGTDADGLTWERISGTDPLARGNTTGPSGGALIDRDQSTALPPGGFVTYPITFATAGDYKVYTRRLARTAAPAGNSIWMGRTLDIGAGDDPAPLEAGTYTEYDNETNGGRDDYIWTSDQPLPGNPPFIYRGVTAGTHTITIGNRENGYTLDRVVLSTNLTLTAAELDLLAAPGAPTVFAGNNAVAVRFSPPPAGSSYNIKRATSASGPFATVGNSTGTEFIDTTAANGTTYFYAITLANPNGESAQSTAVSVTPSATAVPAAPTGVQVRTLNATDYLLTFTPTPFANSFTILRGDTAAGPFTPLGTATGNSFTITGLGPPGEDYYFVVTGTNASGTGPQSSPPVRVVAGQGVTAQYYNETFWGMGNRGDGTTPVNRVGPNPDVRTIVGAVDYDFGSGTPDPKIRPEQHSTVFTGKVAIPIDADGDGTPGETISVQFVGNTDDDGFVYVEDSTGAQVLVSSDGGGHGQRDAETLGPVDLKEGASYDFIVLQSDQGGGSGVHFKWDNPATGTREAVPLSVLLADMDTTEAGGLRAPALGEPSETADTEVTFPLTDNSSNETRFELFRDGVLVGSAPINATEIRDPNPLAGSHAYTVRAANTNGASALSPAVTVDVPAVATDRQGAFAHYYNNGAWSGGRLGSYAGSTAAANQVMAGPADFGVIVDTIDNSSGPDDTRVAADYHSSVFTGKVTIPEDADGDGTAGEVIPVTFINSTDDHGIIFVNGQVAAQDLAPHGERDTPGAPLQLKEGSSYDFVMFQAEQEGGSAAHFRWFNPATGEAEVVPTSQLTPFPSAPAAPANIARVGDAGPVTLSWADNSVSEIRYEIRRSTSADMANAATVFAPVNSTQFVDATAALDKTYYYQVCAINFGGVGCNTTPFQVSPPQGQVQVTQVFVNGQGLTGQTSANGVAFRTLAGVDNTYGYAVPAGANQTKSIPWSNGINQIALRFSQEVASSLQQGDLVVRGINTANYTITNFSYDAATRTGVWTLSAPVTNDKLRLVLAAAGVSGLDGEWTNGSDAYPSGDGTAGGDFNFRINVLRGDATQDGTVNALDLSFVKARLNKSATNPGTTGATYSPFADLVSDGTINAIDLSAARARINNRLPAGEPAATSLLFSSKPISR